VNGPSRLLRAFPASEAKWPKGVSGEWVAWGILESGSDRNGQGPRSRIVAAKGPNGIPKELAVIDGGSGFDDIVWSADGRWIAATAYIGRGDEAEMKILVVGVTPDGDVSVPARLIEPPIVPAAWGLRWLPDASAVTVYAQSRPDWTFHLWLVPLQNGAPPVHLSRDETVPILTNILSPDGEYIAYQVNVERGSSLWLADFGDALSRRD
jgi:Tol biopolymer transport system component